MFKLRPKLPDITVDWILERAVQRGECLIWQLDAANNGTDPRATLHSQRFYVRRAIWKAMQDGREPPPELFIVAGCDEPCCIEPAHLVGRSRSQALTGRTMPLAQRANIAKARRANSKISDELVQRIRASDLSGAEEAEQHGICKAMVNRIRAGEVRRDYTNPFLQLEAR